MSHPAIVQGNIAVITGGAAGIGLAAADAFVKAGLRVCIADVGADRLAEAARRLGHADQVMTAETDVSRFEAVEALAQAVAARWGVPDILMNNAGIQPGSGMFGPRANWERVIDVNLWGVINGVQVFSPAMLGQGTDCAIINTGSKQGITCPPGDTAYNVSKAGVKVLTEALAHSLRNEHGARVTAHLLIPGSTFTGMTSRGQTEKPAGAWTPDQVIDMLIEGIGRGDFYILCPDNDVSRETDNRRIYWAAHDLIDNRPALSRWHPDYKEAFEDFVKAGA